jgi:hypothetical protein
LIDQSLLRQIAGFIFEYIFNGRTGGLSDPDSQKLVEYGVARFGNVDPKIIVDEPLALLGAIHFFNTETEWDLRHFLLDGLSTSYEAGRGIAFEHLGAYLLAVAFGKPRLLSSVFKFYGPGPHLLENETGCLVAIDQTRGSSTCMPVDISSDTRPTYVLGRKCATEDQTLSWLKDPGLSIFCFPASTVGPDLILVLELSNKKVLRVLVQFKQTSSKSTLSFVDTQKAIKTTDPYEFLSQQSKEPNSPGRSKGDQRGDKLDRCALSFLFLYVSYSNPSIQPRPESSTQLVEALGKLGDATDKAGDLGVLRVLISHPAKPNSNALDELAGSDSRHHPIATVNINALANDKKEQYSFCSLDYDVVAGAKRRRHDFALNPPSKWGR